MLCYYYSASLSTFHFSSLSAFKTPLPFNTIYRTVKQRGTYYGRIALFRRAAGHIAYKNSGLGIFNTIPVLC